jgi:hypothetical protein
LPHARAAAQRSRWLLAALAGLDIQIELRATELLMIRERVFPALELDVLHRFPLPGQAT